MQPGRVFMKEHPSRAVKHIGSMVRIPETPVKLIHHSLDTYTLAYAHVLGDTHLHNRIISNNVCVFPWLSK